MPNNIRGRSRAVNLMYSKPLGSTLKGICKLSELDELDERKESRLSRIRRDCYLVPTLSVSLLVLLASSFIATVMRLGPPGLCLLERECRLNSLPCDVDRGCPSISSSKQPHQESGTSARPRYPSHVSYCPALASPAARPLSLCRFPYSNLGRRVMLHSSMRKDKEADDVVWGGDREPASSSRGSDSGSAGRL